VFRHDEPAADAPIAAHIRNRPDVRIVMTIKGGLVPHAEGGGKFDERVHDSTRLELSRH
jgi:hypothetical protein